MQAKKAMGEDSAVDIGVKLAFDEVRYRVIAIAGSCEECLEVLAHRLVQERLFGAMRRVLVRSSGARCWLAIVCGRCFRHLAGAMVRSPCESRSRTWAFARSSDRISVSLSSRATGGRWLI